MHELGGHPVCCARARCSSRAASRCATRRSCCRAWSTRSGSRTGPHAIVEELAAHATVPVINMLTADHHPCQALADLMTLRERFGALGACKLAYVGDGNNVAHSLMLARRDRRRGGRRWPRRRSSQLDAGCRARLAERPAEAVAGAHAIYTDVWVSMGDEDDAERSARAARALPARRGAARPRARRRVALHCLPAHPGEEITEGVLYGERSAVWDQAENRLHAQKALLELLVRLTVTIRGEPRAR